MIRWSAQAEADFNGIHEYVSADSIAAADRQCDRILHSILQLNTYPLSGKRTRRKAIRELAVPGTPYVIRYRVRDDVTLLTTILHGKMKRTP